MKPLFIPLKTEYFEAFKSGTKDTEYRALGPRWNAQTCVVGRAVVLSKGYGRRSRLSGVIESFHVDHQPERLPGWLDCYGSSEPAAACIKIMLEDRT